MFNWFFDEIMFWPFVESLFRFKEFRFFVVKDILVLLVLLVEVVEVRLGSNRS